MDNNFLQAIQQKVAIWRHNGYPRIDKETLNILTHIKKVGFLHEPQIEALETYIYLKEILGNKSSAEIVKVIFDNEKDLISSLGLSKEEAYELVFDKNKEEKINRRIHEQYNSIDYANQVYALTMGAGKTILMGTMMLYDFVLSFYHPGDRRFAKNALVFAPDTTIIESLKEIKSFDYTKVLPREYQTVALNIKYHYLESTDTPLTPIGNYNVVVSNSQKIILKTRHTEENQTALFRDESTLRNRAVENKRLQAIRELNDLIVFVDEAHHSFGTTLEGSLKKTKETINFIHKEGKTPLVAVVNLTGTPYIGGKMISDVVYHFGLNSGIEKGILKQVRFLGYSNVKTQEFIEDVVDKFWNEYSEKRLEEKLPKIAFYAASIEDLRTELRPKIEAILSKLKIPQDKILEYHTKEEKSKDEFLQLDTQGSEKQFILLVGKGTEGWNCRSLVACALYRKPHSSIFVLQSSTRCLRSIGDNSTTATIFLSDENYKVLDRELKNNFATTIEDIGNLEQKTIEHTLVVEKKKKVKVKKKLKEIISATSKDIGKLKIDWQNFNPQNYLPYIAESGILLNAEQKAQYTQKLSREELPIKGNLTFYEIVEIINRYTLLPCLMINDILLGSHLAGHSREGGNPKNIKKVITERINHNLSNLTFAIEQILKSAYKYEEREIIIEEELELTRQYPFKINVVQNKNDLVVYKTDVAEGRLGFHINPYNFDSRNEKGLFAYLREVLDKDEAIIDVYFTGGVSETVHNDFYFEYFSPTEKKLARYFPDFLIETTKNRFLVIEVKTNQEKTNYDQNKITYNGQRDEIFNEVFAKEVGFRDFQEVNKNFEYHLIFDAGLQEQQRMLYQEICNYERKTK